MRVDKENSGLYRWIIIDLLSMLVGIVGGLSAILFKYIVVWFTDFFFNVLLPVISFTIDGVNLGYLFLPIIGGLIIGPMIKKWCPDTKGDGISEIHKLITLKRGIIQKRLAPLKLLISAITIGSGGSAGREGPMGMIGSGFGEFVFRRIKLNPNERRILLICGLVSGLSALYNAPVGASLFGFEVLLGSFDIFNSIPIFLAAIIAYAISIIFFGNTPILVFPPYDKLYSFPLIILYLIFGLIMGFISIGWTKLFFFVRKKFANLKINTMWQPAIGGITVGLLGMFFPLYGFLGTGVDSLNLALFDLAPPLIIIFIAFGKMLCTASTVGSGGSGGAFYPTLVIGACFGDIIGKIFQIILPNTVTTPVLFVILGMAGLFAGISQAPLAITFLISEMSLDFTLVGPLILVSITSFAVNLIYSKGSSFYTIPFENEGVPFKLWSMLRLNQTEAKDIMHEDLPSVHPYNTIQELIVISNDTQKSVLVIDAGQFLGYFTQSQVLNLKSRNDTTEKIENLIPKNPIFTLSHGTLQEVLDFMDEKQVTDVFIAEKTKENIKFRGMININEIFEEESRLSRYQG
jgi:CIC family chloride channel protein